MRTLKAVDLRPADMRRGLANAAMFCLFTGQFAVGCRPSGGRCSLHAETRGHPALLRASGNASFLLQENALRLLSLRLLFCRKSRRKNRLARKPLLRTKRCYVDGLKPRQATLFRRTRRVNNGAMRNAGASHIALPVDCLANFPRSRLGSAGRRPCSGVFWRGHTGRRPVALFSWLRTKQALSPGRLSARWAGPASIIE